MVKSEHHSSVHCLTRDQKVAGLNLSVDLVFFSSVFCTGSTQESILDTSEKLLTETQSINSNIVNK